jgi:CheY-specific phosphatase CheX
MTYHADAVVDPQSLVAIATDVWSTMLESELNPIGPDDVPPALGRTLDGVVAITGGWSGAVVLRVSRPLAVRIARAMFDLGDAEPSLADMQDAVGELTNTTGGNIKGLMPGMCHLSLPTVVEGNDFRVRVPGASVVSELHFLCDDEAVVVQLVAAGASATQTPAGGPRPAAQPY